MPIERSSYWRYVSLSSIQLQSCHWVVGFATQIILWRNGDEEVNSFFFLQIKHSPTTIEGNSTVVNAVKYPFSCCCWPFGKAISLSFLSNISQEWKFSFSLAIVTIFYYNATMSPMNHLKNWINLPVQQANQFKTIVPLCTSQSAADEESNEILRVSYQYQTDINDTGQAKDAAKFRFWNLSKGNLTIIGSD